MAWVVTETVDVERELRAAVAKLSPAFRNDFRFALYEREREILHGRCWSLLWRNGKAIIM